MPKKRAQSPSRPAAVESEAIAGASSSSQPPEPVKEPTPPLQVFYCASQSEISLYFFFSIWFFFFLSEIRTDFFVCFLFCYTVCSFPLEYCEFGSSLTRCKEWLKEEHPDQFDKYYSDGMFSSISYQLLCRNTV